jgi:hypothetical protein
MLNRKFSTFNSSTNHSRVVVRHSKTAVQISNNSAQNEFIE